MGCADFDGAVARAYALASATRPGQSVHHAHWTEHAQALGPPPVDGPIASWEVKENYNTVILPPRAIRSRALHGCSVTWAPLTQIAGLRPASDLSTTTVGRKLDALHDGRHASVVRLYQRCKR